MWTTHLSNIESLQSIFDTLPDLSSIELIEIFLGERIELRFDLQKFPTSSPEKWREFNTVQLTITLINPQNLQIINWQSPLKGTLMIQATEKPQLHFQSGDCTIQCHIDMLYLQKISAYKNNHA